MGGYSRQRNMSTNRPCGKEVRAGRRFWRGAINDVRAGAFLEKSLPTLEPSHPSRIDEALPDH